MQTEKLALVGLVIVIIVALTGFLYVNYGDELFKAEPLIEIGDCADVSYIGRCTDDDTVFDSSYSDVENKTGSTPLNVYVFLDVANYTGSPEGYETYSPGLLEGFMNGIIGMKEGETKTIHIDAKDAYGANKLGVGDSFTTGSLAIEMNQTVEVTEFNDENMSLKWIDVGDIDKFTMPQAIFRDLTSTDPNEMVIIPPPFYLWGDSTEIIDIQDEEVTVKLTPTKSENLTEDIEQVQYTTDELIFIFPDATNATWDNDTVTLTSSPEIGAEYPFSFEYYGQVMSITFIVESYNGSKINISVTYEGSEEKSYEEFESTITFNRTFTLPRLYNDIPSMYMEYFFGQDLEDAGYSLHELAGEDLTFEITVEKIYKTSQTDEES